MIRLIFYLSTPLNVCFEEEAMIDHFRFLLKQGYSL